MSLLTEDTQMSGISPQRKNRNKCKNKTARNDTTDQIPAQVLDEINRILEGRHSPIGCVDGDINDCKHDKTVIKEHNSKEVVLEAKSGRCLLCRCPHNPERARLLAALELMSDSPQFSLWFCNSCKMIIEKERECSLTLKVTATNTTDCSLSATTTISSSTSIATQTTNSSSTTTTTSTSISVTTSSCSCPICKRHEGQQPVHEDLRSCWHELKSAILRIYRESGLVLNQTFMQQNRLELTLQQKCPLPSNERLKEIVHKLCVHDRHKLYQCLEAQVRLFVVEMRLNLLKHLEQGSQALFEAMIDQYGKLCRASKKSAQFLQELESKHLRKFNLTWEFLNRRLFQSTVYSDTFIKHGLPKLTALTKDRSLIDMYARFLKFEDEMTVISVVWREAQQFIDKYEKFAILNKKRALIKEWEQFSVEWVLDDHVSGAGGKGKAADSSMCIKKPSIECLNARFLEEQKLLKSGKNMQSVNIEVETHSALQEQTLLAAYGEWDAIDIKTISNLPPPNRHLKSATAATQVDLLLTSKAKNESPKVVESLDEDECEDDDDCEDEEEDVDDEEDDDDEDDSCSDQSSTTSTSTSNNQREGGRVCDCCYCEVFGHGMPAVAPTSRNYNEMRERLRMRLSKRKAEKCEKNGTQPQIAIENTFKPKDIEKDDRDLEELINFIEGTDSNGKEKKKRDKPKKNKKEKKLVEKEPKICSKEKENKPLTNDSISKTAENVKNHKIDHKSSDHSKDMSVNNNNNHCHQNNITSKQLKDHSIPKTDDLKIEILAQQMAVHSAANHLNHSINGVSNGSAKNSKNNGNNKKKIKISNDRKDDNHLSQTPVPNHIQNQNNNNKTNEQIVCNGVIPHHKQNGTVVSNGAKQTPNHCISPERGDSEIRNNMKQKQNKINKNKKKNNSDEALSPDDVFMPKDIDLDDGQLDEFEKELEAFKRFCFNSKPLKNKEKVNVNLKDIVIKKKND